SPVYTYFPPSKHNCGIESLESHPAAFSTALAHCTQLYVVSKNEKNLPLNYETISTPVIEILPSYSFRSSVVFFS
ncbi:MAG: hypothetical protein ACYTEQ_23545, partial [Planctomycetota bacterium]